ncbi:hypothetical protein DFH28DRAFT_1108318 [Melampsora americana]|nr:hypothetical protein DFH28DRAFT_1108318 [Melampsora americana]
MEKDAKPEGSKGETDQEKLNWPNHQNDESSTSISEPNQSLNPTPIPSLTLSLFRHLFDDRLTWDRKIGCITATLAINLFLPFINGIMLGFGEIAARELVGKYMGWGPLRELYQSNQKNQIKSHQKADDLLPLEPSLTISTDQTRWWQSTNHTSSNQR